MKTHLIYVTTRDRAEARRIGKTLVKERLAACVNILGGMESVYRWKGKIESAREAVLIAKTTAKLVPKLIRRVKALHSYECPCVVALPVEGGNADFLDWIRRETK